MYRSLRLRGTFIDFGQCAPCEDRSHSAPPRRLENASDDSQQIEELVERTACSFFWGKKSKRSSMLHPQEHDGCARSRERGLTEQDRMCMKTTDTKLNQSNVQSWPTLQSEDGSMQCAKDESPFASNLALADLRLQSQRPFDVSSFATKVTTWAGEASNTVHVQPPMSKIPVAANVTTLMICNIAGYMTAQHILDRVNEHGFADAYNLFYMPMPVTCSSPRKGSHLGYAFMNFKTQEYADAFVDAFQSFNFPKRSSKKFCYTKQARCQGFEAGMDMYLSNKGSGWLGILGDDGFFRRTSK